MKKLKDEKQLDDSFTAEPLINIHKYPEDLFTLEVILGEEDDEKGIGDKKMYSCNNRRLCPARRCGSPERALLKNLVKIGFLGKVKCRVVPVCRHRVVLSTKDPFVQKGNVRGAYCNELFSG